MSVDQIKDLTTTASGDIDINNKNLETPIGSARGTESELSCPECNSTKIYKNKYKDDPRFGDGDYACNNCGNTFNSGSEGTHYNIATGKDEKNPTRKEYNIATGKDEDVEYDPTEANEDLNDPSRKWDNTSNQLKREWGLPEIYINARWEELDDSLQNHIKGLWEKWLGENKANEELSVAGPPADSNMNMIGSTHVRKDENLSQNDDLTSHDLTSNRLGEGQWKGGVDSKWLEDVHDEEIRKSGHPENWTLSSKKFGENNNDVNCEYCNGEGCEKCDGEGKVWESVKPNDPIMLNENYIEDQFGILYRPVYVGEAFTPTKDTLIYNNKYYTTEGLGNCAFCQGAGKVTVENLGLKDCPDCDGTGDIQQAQSDIMNPQIGGDPSMQIPEQQPNNGAPDQFGEPDQSTGHDQFPQQPSEDPEKPKFGEAFIPKIDSKIDELINQRLRIKLGESNPNRDNDTGRFSYLSKQHPDTLTDEELDELEKNYKHSKESCGCKKKAQEASIKKYKTFIAGQLDILKKKAHAGEAVSVMYGLPTLSRKGRKIKGTLAYAGVSLNDRIYLPEELAKGHGKTLPLLLNHSCEAGAENELHRLDDEMRNALANEDDYQVGEVTLTWDADKLTLFYEGVVDHPFFQKEIDDMDMAVSLGIYYDSDSPKVCDENCYTLIKGAEFREVSLVYHAGFPIATIEAVEAELKQNALKAQEDSLLKVDEEPEGTNVTVLDEWDKKANEDHLEGARHQMHNDIARINKSDPLDEEQDKYGLDWQRGEEKGDVSPFSKDPEGSKEEKERYDKYEAEEETDLLARGGAVDVEEKPQEQVDQQIIIAESFTTPSNFSVRGITGMTVSNTNGVQKYTLDATNGYENNMIHFDVGEKGAEVYGEQLQPKMGTPKEVTKDIEKVPNVKFQEPDEDLLKNKRG